MKTLYIDRKSAELEVQGGRLIVRIPDQHRPVSVPLNVLEFLVVSASVSFSSTLLTGLTQAGITAVFLNPRKEEATCIAYGLLHNDAERRLLQYQAISQPQQQLHLARELVRQKLRGQRATLTRALRKRPDQRYPLNKGIERLTAIENKLDAANNIDSLRGLEGSGAALYFEAYQSVFAPSLNFNGRNRRPPRDPVNAVLSLSYTMIHAEAIRALVAAGFDPQLGIYHLPSFGRESLACDLVELFRPLVDRWVWRIFAEELLRPDHFTTGHENADNAPCLLGKAGRAIFYNHYESSVRAWRKLMRRTLRGWLAVLQNEFSSRNDRMQENQIDNTDYIDFGDAP